MDNLDQQQVTASLVPENAEAMTPGQIRQLLGQLEEQRIGLERRTQELLRVQAQSDAACRWYSALYNLAPVGICILNREEIILDANPAAARLLGKDHDLLTGQPFTRFVVEEDREHYADLHRQATGSRAAEARELRMMRPDGTVFWAQLQLVCAKGNHDEPFCHIAFSDVSERKQTEISLREAKEFLEAAFAQSPSGILIADAPNATIRMANPAAVRIRGGNPQDLIGIDADQHAARWQTFLPDGSPYPHEKLPLARAVVQGEVTQHEELIVRDEEGCDHWVDVTATPIRSATGEVNAGILIFDDITPRKQAEKALRESQEMFRDLSDKALVGVYLIQDGVFVYANAMLAQIHGYPIDELVGKMGPLQVVHPDDVPLVRKNLENRISGKQAFSAYEFRIVTKSGQIKNVGVYGSRTLYRGKSAVIGTLVDITERKKAEEALRRSEEQLSLALAVSDAGVWQWNRKTDKVHFDDRIHAMLGYLPGELPTTLDSWLSFLHPEDLPLLLSKTDAHLRGESPVFESEHRIRNKSGTWTWVLTRGRTVHLASEDANLLIGTAMNTSQHKMVEEALRLNAERVQVLLTLNQMTGATLQEITDYALEEAVRLSQSKIGYLAFVNDDETVLTIHSWSKQAMQKCAILDKPIHYNMSETGLWGEVVRQRRPVITNDYEAPNPLKKGYPSGHLAIKRHMNVPVIVGQHVVLVAGVGNKEGEYDEDDARQLTLLMEGMWRLIERKHAEQALRESEDRFQLSMEATNDGLWDWNILMDQGYFSPAYFRMLGYEPGDFPERSEAWKGLLHPEDRQRALQINTDCIEGRCEHFEVEYRMKAKDGQWRWILGRGKCVARDEKGRAVRLVGTHVDITDRKQAEEDFRREQIFTQTLLDSLPGIFYLYSYPELRLVRWNKNHETLLGYGPGKLKGQSIMHWYPPELKPVIEQAIRVVMEEGVNTIESHLLTKDGHSIPFLLTGMRLDLPGQTYLMGVGIDVTDRKQAEEEKANLQSQLHQALKMESVGRLAGGVAHDFNNMLGVILGHVELAQELISTNHPVHEDLEEIRKAANRSADLTRQLLAFARQQAVTPKVLDLDQTVAGMLKMLERLIGERIRLVWHPQHDLWPVKMDPSQIDQILANLCVNARDAIRDIGEINIEMCNCAIERDYCVDHPGFLPGQYVRLTVSDNGCGIDRGTLPHIFEPFFTTKGLGEGTGLGLATVYGIVKQNNGFINVYSEPGEGTAFAIYLPRHEGASEPAPAHDAPRVAVPERKTILLVEDEPSLLELTSRMLEGMGHTVFRAASPSEALRLAQQHADRIQLLMSDVVMPEMNGRDLTERILSLNPDLKTLFMSGYTADVIVHHGVLEEGVVFIQKPFSRPTLAAKIREALDHGERASNAEQKDP